MRKLLTTIFSAFAVFIATPAMAEELANIDYQLPRNLEVTDEGVAVTPPNPKNNWDRVKHIEHAYLVMSALDIVSTKLALNNGARELNPIYGSNPSLGKMIAIKTAGGIIHYLLVKEIAKTDPKAARTIAIVSLVVQTGVVGLNMRYAF